MEELSRELQEKRDRELSDPVILAHIARTRREATHGGDASPVVDKTKESKRRAKKADVEELALEE